VAVGVGAAGAVVPGAAIPEREASGVELGATRGAHRHTEVGTVEDEGLPGEGIEVGWVLMLWERIFPLKGFGAS
jgi:hypothetical protein